MTSTTSNPNLPAGWSDADQLDGLELVDKATLIAIPFRITSVYFETNTRGVEYVYVDGETQDGGGFTFNDSSTGVRAQIITHLKQKGLDAAVDSGEVVPLNLVIPRGLRASEFDVTDDRGRPKRARTYYLTTSGKRAGLPAPDGKAASAVTRKARTGQTA